MRKLSIVEVNKLREIINCYKFCQFSKDVFLHMENGTSIYPAPNGKIFFEVNVAEMKILSNTLSESAQVITIERKTNMLTDLIPIRELVKTNFKYFKDSSHSTDKSVEARFIFIIYESYKKLKWLIDEQTKLLT